MAENDSQRITGGLADQATIALLSAAGKAAQDRRLEGKGDGRPKTVSEADKNPPKKAEQGESSGGAKEGDGQTGAKTRAETNH